ncbi:MAG: hypothetical protein KGL48_02480 [Sphingomonadales bacterium]|nr:hypothetical protein [Sphingomonadales bacterium]MDE2569699.1 hypothetical protein [Sphingomonadales bacterium]
MSHFAFEFVLAAVLALAVLWVWRKQEPRRPLRADEIERYLSIVDQRFPLPDATPKAELLARLRHFAEADDGRDVYMLNLLRYHERMATGPAPAGSFAGTPHEANAIYEANAKSILLKSGAFPIFAGKVTEPNAVGGSDPAEDNWTRILVVHYPSRRHFFDLLTDSQYLTKADFKSYAMHMALVPVKRELVIPDFRFLAMVGAVVMFLLAAWIHALLGA